MEKNLTREYTPETIEVDSNVITFSVASEIPYTRTDEKGNPYNEVLQISEEAIDFCRLVDERCPFIYEHDTDKQLGVVERAYIKDAKLYVDVRFSENEFPQNVLKDIKSGIRRNTSIGYSINDYTMIPGDIPTMLVTRWMPYECTSCSCPADYSVGFNRSMETTTMNTEDNKEEVKEPIETPTEVCEEKACEKKEIEEGPSKDEIVDELQANIYEIVDELQAKIAELEAELEATQVANEVTEEKTCGKKECDKPECDEECNGECEDANEIRSLGEMLNKRDLAEEFIANNRSLTEFKEKINQLNNLKENKKSMEKFSIRKAILNACGEMSDDNASFERSIIDENKRKFNSNSSIVVTKEQLRGFPDGTEALNQPTYRPDQYTQNLRPQSVLDKTGARHVAVDGTDIKFGVCVSGLNAGFVGINGEIPSSEMSWELKEMTPKKAGCYIQISKGALLQDRPDIENLILDDISKALNQAVDQAAIAGTGENNQPKGIYNTSGINEVTLPSGDWTLSTALAFEKPIRDANDFSENLHWVMNSNMYYKLAATPKSAKEKNEFLINDERKMIGYDCVICNALPTSGIILGNFDELLVADFNAMEIDVVTDASLSRKQAKEVQAFTAVDCLVRRKKSFTKGA